MTDFKQITSPYINDLQQEIYSSFRTFYAKYDIILIDSDKFFINNDLTIIGDAFVEDFSDLYIRRIKYIHKVISEIYLKLIQNKNSKGMSFNFSTDDQQQIETLLEKISIFQNYVEDIIYIQYDSEYIGWHDIFYGELQACTNKRITLYKKHVLNNIYSEHHHYPSNIKYIKNFWKAAGYSY